MPWQNDIYMDVTSITEPVDLSEAQEILQDTPLFMSRLSYRIWWA